MYNGGQDPETYRRVGKIAGDAGLQFHTWIKVFITTPRSLRPDTCMSVGLYHHTTSRQRYQQMEAVSIEF